LNLVSSLPMQRLFAFLTTKNSLPISTPLVKGKMNIY